MNKRDDIYIVQMLDRIGRLQSHLRGVSRATFLKSPLHQAAVVRELEVIGEAARQVSEGTRLLAPELPWQQMIGMRNRLIHGYFDVDYDIVWNVATREIHALEPKLEALALQAAPSLHPWRPCPRGYYFVRAHSRRVSLTAANPDGKASVREHCRRNPSGKDQLYPKEIPWMVEGGLQRLQPGDYPGTLVSPANANEYDALIAFWTRYWNEIFVPTIPLSPNVVKALFASESSFNPKVKAQRLSTRNFARGPLQITDQTRKVLGDEHGELADHYLTLDKDDVLDPEIALAAAVRWLFHKRETAKRHLGRDASWEEAVAEYKGYLRLKPPYSSRKGMKVFSDWLVKLEGRASK
jgi:uncharacterized protein with HEPN domain